MAIGWQLKKEWCKIKGIVIRENGQMKIFENHREFIAMKMEEGLSMKGHMETFMIFVSFKQLKLLSLHSTTFSLFNKWTSCIAFCRLSLISSAIFPSTRSLLALAFPRVSLRYGGEGGVIKLVPLILAIKGQQISIIKHLNLNGRENREKREKNSKQQFCFEV